MSTIGIIGGGNVGANAAFFLAEKDVADVVLYDIQEGMAEGKALDLIEASPIRFYQTKVSGTSSIEDMLDTDVVVVTVGSERKPGMQREELFNENKAVINDIAGTLSGYKGVVIITTEPMDATTTAFVRKSKLSPRRVMGLGTCLDSTRLRYLIARELSMSFEGVSAMVIGRHTGEMIPLPSYCRVSGVPVASLIQENRLEAIIEEMKKSGDRIVDLAQRSAAFYGPAAVISDLAEAIIRNTRRILPVSHLLSGQYGIDGVAMSLPAVIGKNGIEKTLVPILEDDQKRALAASAKSIRSVVG